MSKGPRIIALETSAQLGSVAAAAGPQLLLEKEFKADLRHASELVPAMDELAQAQGWQPGDIDQLYVSAGPGSFTGLRTGITVAKAFAFAHPRLKVVAIPSGDVLILNAQQAAVEENTDIRYAGVVIEAGRNQIYGAVFERLAPGDGRGDNHVPGFAPLIEMGLMSPGQLLAQAPRPIYLLGPGISYHVAELTADEVVFLPEKYWRPRAAAVHRCGWQRAQAGEFAVPDQLTPIYLRRPEAVEKWERLHGKA